MQETVNASSLLEKIVNNKNFKKYNDNNSTDINNLVELLADDLYYIYNNIIDVFNIDIIYTEEKELNISINFIQTSTILNDGLFYKAIDYYEKYEQYLIDNELYDISVDFNVTTENENVKIITVYSS